MSNDANFNNILRITLGYIVQSCYEIIMHTTNRRMLRVCISSSSILMFNIPHSSADEIVIAVYKSINLDAPKFFYNKNIFLANKSKDNSIALFHDFLRDKMLTSGYKIDDGSSQNRITVIQNKILHNQYRMSPKSFPVNYSIDTMLCHDPIYPNTGTGYISYKCDHIVFEFLKRYNFDTENFFSKLWEILIESRPAPENGTYAFSNVEYHRVFINTKL